MTPKFPQKITLYSFAVFIRQPTLFINDTYGPESTVYCLSEIIHRINVPSYDQDSDTADLVQPSNNLLT